MMSPQEQLKSLEQHIGRQIIGQKILINRLLIALLADGHLLVEGAPGLAKTRAIKVLGDGIAGDFHRIQFTPDLLPADLTGTEIFRPQDGSFTFQRGPLFHNLILADEINRAPAKVQSALLEAMAERQITIGSVSHLLPRLFLVMATQNPIEQEGTYPLPEAQLDRFLMHVRIDYPDAVEERQILYLARDEARQNASPVVPDLLLEQKALFDARDQVLEIHMAAALEEYLLQIVLATRSPERYSESLASWVEYGASPRATIALDRCARAHAWLAGRDYVKPEDIQALAYDVLRHRVLLSYEAEAEGVTADQFIGEILSIVAVP
ncbi:MAG: MoxR family ATPase [Chromatiaceae bacterium]|nr:MoxR family ATPase [Chromatiaceae bacterium]MCP5408842.1 MoxR family ATPase [Chromatiaceae bacterium]MCP5445051.1 MoxR family ATPase [Chromatiaceae bacterium]